MIQPVALEVTLVVIMINPVALEVTLAVIMIHPVALEAILAVDAPHLEVLMVIETDRQVDLLLNTVLQAAQVVKINSQLKLREVFAIQLLL